MLLPVHNVDIVRWWMDTIRSPTQAEVKEAARTDQLEVIELLGWDDTGYSHYHRLMLHLDVKGRRPFTGWNSLYILSNACDSPSSQRVIDACLQRYEFLQCISRGGHLDIIKKLFSLKNVVHPNIVWRDVLEGAVQRGRRDIISWVKHQRQDDPQFFADCMYKFSLLHNRIDLLDWLEEGGITHPVNHSDLCEFAALSGDVKVMQWARKRDFPWRFSFQAACQSGNLQMVQYCIQNDCPNKNIEWTTLEAGSIEVLNWLYDNGRLPNDVLSQSLHHLFERKFELVQWLHDRGIHNDRLCEQTVLFDQIQVMTWALDRGYPFTSDSIQLGFSFGSRDMMEWLFERGLIAMRDLEEGHDWMVDVCFKKIENFNVPVYEWMMMKKWKVSEGEVRTLFDRPTEELTSKMLKDVWKNGFHSRSLVQRVFGFLSNKKTRE
ncbi:hypothetical protein PROFUN_08150 [Planoprotostelium fungivorum]|uniref:Ankyrin repeat protein n=1 Tax=Planoprotostelium fungivorum TaxID=1890364 RepID=A0A2P6MQI1_9EUKA|nr:hypothetical protein PROFUN_08150 [Planoprotostelium fungivorum]